MRKRLQALIQLILSYNTHAGHNFELTRKLYSLLLFHYFYARSPQTEEEQAQAYALVDEMLENQVADLQTLPEELLEDVEDLRYMCFGYISKETRAKLKAYYEKNKSV